MAAIITAIINNTIRINIIVENGLRNKCFNIFRLSISYFLNRMIFFPVKYNTERNTIIRNRTWTTSVNTVLLFIENNATGSTSKFITTIEKISARKINTTSLADSFSLLKIPDFSYKLFIIVKK